MAIKLMKGCFYEFHRSRAINRPGAELYLTDKFEIGPEVPGSVALRQVNSGRDVYTPFRADAYKMACSAYGGLAPKWDGSHPESERYFPHYHPGDMHTEEWKRKASKGRPISADAPGHVYWGSRGELKGEKQGRND
jgi:hypothetical protein